MGSCEIKADVSWDYPGSLQDFDLQCRGCRFVPIWDLGAKIPYASQPKKTPKYKAETPL